MSGINQIQMKFVPKQDRILFRINTTDSEEFLFWLTRRYVKLLWKILVELLSKNEQIATQQSDLAKKEILSFQQQEATQNMDFSKEYQEQEIAHQPLGSEPILLEKITVKNSEDGSQTLCMHPDAGQGIDLALNQTLLHSICKLIQESVTQAEWDMDLGPAVNTESPTAGQETRTIN